jgi:hypothetical protein
LMNQMRMQLVPGEVFSCFVFGLVSSRPNLPEEIELRPGVWLSRELPAEPQEHWREWLGSIAMRDLSSGAIVLTAKRKPSTGAVLDEELQTTLNLVWYGVLLQGVPSYRRGFHFSGVNQNGSTEIKRFGNLETSYPTTGFADLETLRIGLDELGRAVELAERLKFVNRKGPDWSRFRRGLQILFRGSREPQYQAVASIRANHLRL